MAAIYGITSIFASDVRSRPLVRSAPLSTRKTSPHSLPPLGSVGGSYIHFVVRLFGELSQVNQITNFNYLNQLLDFQNLISR